MRLIDADALMPKFKAIHEAESQIYGRGSWRFSLKCIDALDDAPTIEPERKRGRWIDGECSACGYGVEPWNNTPYCPNCGAYNEW